MRLPHVESVPQDRSDLSEEVRTQLLKEWREHFERHHKRRSISVEKLADGQYRYPVVQERWRLYFDHRVNLIVLSLGDRDPNTAASFMSLMDEVRP